MTVHEFRAKSIDGTDVSLSDYRGKVLLIVNVASACGFTPQYAGLEKVHDKYKDRGFAVLGFPCNQFGRQEPGTNKEIAEFCTSEYGVTFPMLAKVDVNGKNACPLYKHLTGKDTDPKFAGAIKWNFEKFLVARNGEIVARFASDADLEGETFLKALKTCLGN